jgi:hypothetical protein
LELEIHYGKCKPHAISALVPVEPLREVGPPLLVQTQGFAANLEPVVVHINNLEIAAKAIVGDFGVAKAERLTKLQHKWCASPKL